MTALVRPVLIGLTGPIGCGKSTITGWLAARGAAVVDADRLARAALEPGEPAFRAVVAAFGPEIVAPDGRLDRAALAERVFADPAERSRLEAITSPAVRPRIEAAIVAAAAAGTGAVVLEAIRLIESGWAERCDEVWLVTCDPAVQRVRLLGRGMAPDDAAARIAAQAGLAERVAPRATRTIEASGSLAEVEAAVGAALADALARHRERVSAD